MLMTRIVVIIDDEVEYGQNIVIVGSESPSA